eukprot:COSAG05_NODE_12_length_37297_cov_117.537072_35_plen_123_part_00
MELETGTDPIVTGSKNSWNAVFADVNRDGSPDLYVVNDGQPNQLFFSDKKGGFVVQAESNNAVKEMAGLNLFNSSLSSQVDQKRPKGSKNKETKEERQKRRAAMKLKLQKIHALKLSMGSMK